MTYHALVVCFEFYIICVMHVLTNIIAPTVYNNSYALFISRNYVKLVPTLLMMMTVGGARSPTEINMQLDFRLNISSKNLIFPHYPAVTQA